MAVSGLEDGAGTHKNKLPLSAELQNTLEDRNGRHEIFCMGVVYNVNGREEVVGYYSRAMGKKMLSNYFHRCRHKGGADE